MRVDGKERAIMEGKDVTARITKTCEALAKRGIRSRLNAQKRGE
jgi:hypothetical protein